MPKNDIFVVAVALIYTVVFYYTVVTENVFRLTKQP